MEQKEEPAYCMIIEGDEGMNGEGERYSNILQYLKDGTYSKSANKNDQLTIRSCPLITLFMVKGYIEDRMIEFISFA